MCIYRFYGGKTIRGWYKYRYKGCAEPVKKKAKIGSDEDQMANLPKNVTIPSTFDPVTYLTSKVNSIKLQRAHRDLKKGSLDFDGYIWHRGNCANWATTVREAPVGSILRRDRNLFSETQSGQVGNFVQEHFVKTAHLQSLLEKLDKAVENKERSSYFMHGISGVGKTYALDAVHCCALEKGLFVIHMKSGSYDNIWRYDLRAYSWEFLFLREIFNNRSMPKLREHFDLPPNPRAKKKRKGREEECEDILEKIDEIINKTTISPQAKNYIANQYFKKFWDQVLTDDYDIVENGRKKKMVCIIFDDINALSKGRTKSSGNLTKLELAHHKRIGANILGLLEMDQSKSTHKIATAKNAILFCAASQHYKGSSTVSNQEGFRRINPPTSVPELYGFSAYFMPALTRRKLRDLTHDRVLKCLITETGMVARLIVRSIEAAHGQSANLNDLSGDQARMIIDLYAEAVRSQISQAIRNRYSEVFRSFHEAQNKNLAVMGVKPGNNRMKDTHGELVRITSDVYNLNIFQLKRCNPATANVSDDDNPYLDAGLIVESPLKPTFYGFVSRFARIEFAREMFKQHGIYKFYTYLKDSSDNRAFEQRVTTTLMFGGYDGALHRYKGGAQVYLPKIPAANFIMTLSFDYTGANVAKKTLSAVSFCDTNGDTSTGASSSVRDYKIWMNDNHNFTQSILLVSKRPETGGGGVQMPAFDQISIVKEVTPARRCTYMFLFQTTMEQPTDATIPAARFGKFEKNGLKILQKLVQHAFGDSYKIRKSSRTDSSEPNFEVHKPAGTRVPNFEIRIVYVSMKKTCMTSGNSDLEVLVVPYGDVIKKFGIGDQLLRKK